VSDQSTPDTSPEMIFAIRRRLERAELERGAARDEILDPVIRRIPDLLDEIERLRAELDAPPAVAAVQPLAGIVFNISPPHGNLDEAFAAGRASALRDLRRRGGLRHGGGLV
jgi:hypothetical protein